MSTDLPYSKQELFLRISNNDESAFTTAFHHYTRFIFPYVLKKIKSDDIAREIIQETFLRLWKYRDNLKETSSPEGYLFRIVANLLQDHFRKLGRESKLKVNLKEGEENTDIHYEYTETKRIYDQAVAHLPPQQRHVYDLREEGFSYDEIAGKLGISVHTVKNHIVKAGKTIRQFAKQKGLSAMIWLFP